jgi:DNA-3-methyladenine glycosylase
MTEPMHDLLSRDDLDTMSVLSRGFYQRPTDDVARALLGKILVRETAEGVVAVRITEVEAYLGIEDPACHTFRGRRTARTATMWGPAGHAYVYLIYGLHSCLNIVTVGEGEPEAVLVRGAEPLLGGALIRRRRGPGIRSRHWVDGPGKLCQALAITRDDDGSDLCRPDAGLAIRTDGLSVGEESVERLPRVGVDYAGDAARWPLRLRVSEP